MMMMLKIQLLLIVTFVIWISFPLLADDKSSFKMGGEKGKEDVISIRSPLSGQYRSVALGLERSDVLEILNKDPMLLVNKDSALGLFDQLNEHVILASGLPFIEKIYYQFLPVPKLVSKVLAERKSSKWVLHSIVIVWNRQYHNIYTLSDLLSQKYGESDIVTPQHRIWNSTNRKRAMGLAERGLLNLAKEYSSHLDASQPNDVQSFPIQIVLTHPSTVRIMHGGLSNSFGKNDEEFSVYQRRLRDELAEDFKKEKDDAQVPVMGTLETKEQIEKKEGA